NWHVLQTTTKQKAVSMSTGVETLMAKSIVIVEFLKYLVIVFMLYYQTKTTPFCNYTKLSLPIAIKDYLQGIKAKDEINENSIFEDIKESSNKKERNILEQITFENYSYYLGFDKL